MATLGDMRTRIANELQIDSSTFQSDIDDAIFTSIAFYEDKDFWFKDGTPATFLLSSTAKYPLVTVLPGRSEIREMVLHLTPGKSEMHFRTLREFLDLDFDEGFTGQPAYWTIDHDNLMVYPTPNVTRTAEIYYTLRLSMTASASASSVWTNEAEELVRLHAEIDLLENRIMDDATAMRKRGRLSEVLHNMDLKTITQRGARRAKPWM